MFSSIQMLRGFAAVAVCMFHLSIGLGDSRYLGHQVLDSVTWRGNLGVDFFFVLSGFIIAFAHHKDIGRPAAWRTFISKRIIRLYPIYLLYVGVICVLLALGFGQVKKLPDTLSQWVVTVFLIRLDESEPILPPAWTLVHEIGFYAIFSLLILSRRLGATVALFWVVMCVVFFQYPSVNERTAFNTYFAAYNLDFLFGVCVYLIWKKAPNINWIIPAILGVAVVGSTMAAELRRPDQNVYSLLYGIGFGLILLAAVYWESSGRQISSKLLALLGDASYSIYLTHEPLQGIFMKIMLKTKIHMYAGETSAYFFVLVFSTLFGCLAYLWVERPLLNAIRRHQLRRAQSQAARVRFKS
jgi:exopolysaccharide production protein ExoZ